MNLHNPNPLQPKFSVIVPVYNRAKMVTEAIESVLSQSFRQFELIVVDDGSVDETPKVLEQYRDKAQIITQKSSGPEIARNRGAEAAKGEYLVFLDSDDLVVQGTLAVYEKVLSATDHPSLVIARMFHFHSYKPTLLKKADNEVEVVVYRDLLSKDRPLEKSNSVIVVRKDVFRNAGCFRHEPRRTHPCDDDDFFLRAGVYGPVAVILKPPTVGYRTHEGNVTMDLKRMTKSVGSLILSEREGAYPGGRTRLLERYAFIGGLVYDWSKRAFWSGSPGLGLWLFAIGYPMVFAAVFRKFLIELKGKKPTIRIKL